MPPLISILPLLGVAFALSVMAPSEMPPQRVLDNSLEESYGFKIPSVHESAIMARRILHLTTIGTLVTSFPDPNESFDDHDEVKTLENRPEAVHGSPVGLMEYIADCEGTGNPTLLALNIATPFKNYAAGSNVSLSLRWWPKQTSSYSWTRSITPSNLHKYLEHQELYTPHAPAALPRFSLHGRLESISESTLVPACFINAHPDSVWWQPGNKIHEAQYMRFVVTHVYWIGGFGDRARIQWLPIEEWRNVTMREITDCRLPGEEKKKQDWMSGLKEWL